MNHYFMFVIAETGSLLWGKCEEDLLSFNVSCSDFCYRDPGGANTNDYIHPHSRTCSLSRGLKSEMKRSRKMKRDRRREENIESRR